MRVRISEENTERIREASWYFGGVPVTWFLNTLIEAMKPEEMIDFVETVLQHYRQGDPNGLLDPRPNRIVATEIHAYHHLRRKDANNSKEIDS